MICITDERLSYKSWRGVLAGATVVASLFASTLAPAAPCPTDLPNPLYGAGGSAVTATLGAVATALAGLPDGQRVSLFYWDPGACVGYEAFVKKNSTPVYFKYWNAAGQLTQCEASGQEVLSFAHMGNTPALCPANEPLPTGFGRFVAPIQTINLVTHRSSQYDSVSAEALYHVFGFGPGATGRGVVPWTVPQAVFGRTSSSFVHQALARTIFKVPPAFKLPPANVLSTNPQTVQAVFQWGESNDPSQPLGYVSGSAADKGEDDKQIKTLAFQSYDQSCAHLPDSSRARKDKLNVRKGQYALWTPAWFYARTDAGGSITSPAVANLIHWFDGTQAAPSGIDATQIVIKSGDIPLCAMQANRPDGDLTPPVSFAPANPCNGYFEFVATGSTTHKACTGASDCNTAAGESCRFGFCEAY